MPILLTLMPLLWSLIKLVIILLPHTQLLILPMLSFSASTLCVKLFNKGGRGICYVKTAGGTQTSGRRYVARSKGNTA